MKHTLINVEEHEIRIAILEDGKLVELFIENPESRTLVGNIYKGKITDVKPGIQAAFVDIGLEKNAFLHFDDFRAEALNQFKSDDDKKSPDKKSKKKSKSGQAQRKSRRPADVMKPGQEILVQVIKDPISTKGCRITTNISLPGRFLVFLPYSSQTNGGVSRKIEEYKERRRLKSILRKIEKEGESYIIRTSGVDQSSEDIHSDVEQLRKTWGGIIRKANKVDAPELLQNDHEIIIRVARDILQTNVNEIWIDNRAVYNKLSKYIKTNIPELDGRLFNYNEMVGLFDRFDVERQIIQALRRKVWLKSGGTLIFDEMEAMTAIDVNTGKFTGQKNPGKTILKTNLEAARAIAAQLRLRDIGGLVVVDFIDMDSNEDRKKLVHELNTYMKSDRAKHMILSVNEFGLVAMTRKRVRESLKKFFHNECPHCEGSGLLLTEQQIWRAVKREILILLETAPRPHLTIRIHSAIKDYINQNHMEDVIKWCNRYRIEIQLLGWKGFSHREFEIEIRKKVKGKKSASGDVKKYFAWHQSGENPYKGKMLTQEEKSEGATAEITEEIKEEQPESKAEQNDTTQEGTAKSSRLSRRRRKKHSKSEHQVNEQTESSKDQKQETKTKRDSTRSNKKSETEKESRFKRRSLKSNARRKSKVTKEESNLDHSPNQQSLKSPQPATNGNNENISTPKPEQKSSQRKSGLLRRSSRKGSTFDLSLDHVPEKKPRHSENILDRVFAAVEQKYQQKPTEAAAESKSPNPVTKTKDAPGKTEVPVAKADKRIQTSVEKDNAEDTEKTKKPKSQKGKTVKKAKTTDKKTTAKKKTVKKKAAKTTPKKATVKKSKTVKAKKTVTKKADKSIKKTVKKVTKAKTAKAKKATGAKKVSKKAKSVEKTIAKKK